MKPQRPYLFDAIYRWLLDSEWTPHLLVDTSTVGVEVPFGLIKDNKIILNIEPNAIVDFCTEDFGIFFSARFSGKSQQIVVPYSAMIALFSKETGQGLTFPPEVFTEIGALSGHVDNQVSETMPTQVVKSKAKPLIDPKNNKKNSNKKPSLKIIK